MSATAASLDLDLADIPVLSDDLLLRLNAIREAKPIFWSDIQKGWFVTRFQDVSDGFMGLLPLSNARLDKVAFAAIPEAEWQVRVPLLTGATPTFANMTDPPYHSRLRLPMNAAFTRGKVEVLRAFVKARVAELLDQAGDLKEFEFIDVIARPLTASVIMRLMGMPDEYLPHMKGWVNSIVNALGTPNPSVALLEEGEAAMRDMNVIFKEQLALRKLQPTGDLFTFLAKLTEGEDGFTEYEMLGTCVNLLLAGHESTSSTIAMGMAALAERPDQIAYLRAHPERGLETVAELGRFVGMSACMTRLASADFEWHGEKIRKGDVVYLWMASANRDPRVFDRPDELDLSRNASESLAFAKGIHHCLGHLLAKLEMAEFFNVAFDRFAWNMRDPALNFTGSYSFRTLAELNVGVAVTSST